MAESLTELYSSSCLTVTWCLIFLSLQEITKTVVRMSAHYVSALFLLCLHTLFIVHIFVLSLQFLVVSALLFFTVFALSFGALPPPFALVCTSSVCLDKKNPTLLQTLSK